MHSIIRRLIAAASASCIVFSLSFAAAEETAAPILYTHSSSVRTEAGVTVTGTRAMVDFAAVQSQNPACVGWLYQESTALSQHIMQGADNEFYLSHGFDKAKMNNKGSIVLDIANRRDFSDEVIYLYGVGREGSCFETLNHYDEQDYYAQHPSLRLITPQGDWHADIFACLSTKQRDNTSWAVPEDPGEFQPWLNGVLTSSHITAGFMPEAGDKLLVMVVNNANSRRKVVLSVLRPITYETQDECNLVKQPMDMLETGNGWMQAGDLGTYMVYAQNDPIFDRMRYESSYNPTYRVFGGGGCGPTAAAIAIANLVDAKDLPRLAEHAKNNLGTLMCPCSVNRVYCTHAHAAYQLQTPEEYLRYLPVAMADFAAGNNEWSHLSRRVGSGGSSIAFLDLVCDIYGLKRTNVKNLTDGLETMKAIRNDGLMVCTALRKSPYTNGSHFVVVAGVDDEYFYVLDPWRRDDYKKTDTREILELLSPGVTRIKLSDSGLSDLSPVYIIQNPAR